MLSDWGPAIAVRFVILKHMLLGHKVRRTARDNEANCAGDTYCDTCKLLLWCRWYDPWKRHDANTV